MQPVHMLLSSQCSPAAPGAAFSDQMEFLLLLLFQKSQVLH